MKEDCWIYLGDHHRQGYGYIHRYNGSQLAHRASYEAHNGDIPKGMCVLHSCDYPPCINPKHLSLGTYADNNKQAWERKRRNATGENNSRAYLNADQVIAIRSLYSNGLSVRVLAKQYNTTRGNIWLIIKRKSWRHI